MMKVLLRLADGGSRKVTASASNVLVKVCMSGSGEDGCTVAEQDEIDVLLDALTWPNNHIRLLALKVSFLFTDLKTVILFMIAKSSQIWLYKLVLASSLFHLWSEKE